MSKYRRLIENIDARAVVVDTLPELDISPDPKDNPILATAMAGKADFIVTRDKTHMLDLGGVHGIAIVTARDALTRLGG